MYIYYITGYTIVRIYKKPNVPLTFIKTSLLRVRKGTFLLLSLTTRVQEARWADSTLKGSTRDKREEGYGNVCRVVCYTFKSVTEKVAREGCRMGHT